MDMNQALFDRMAFINRSASFGWLTTILTLSCRAVNAHVAWISLLDKNDRFSIEAAHNCPDTADPASLEGGLCRVAVNKGSSVLSRNLSMETSLSAFEKGQKIYSLLCMPLPGREGILGVMAFGKKFLEDFTESQIRQISSTALISGAFIENIRLNMRLEEVFLEAMKSLAQAIDARDPYTFGHSTRVSEVSGEIARRLGLPSEEIQRITLAGVVHDIGKIGVPEAILHKPGKLTDEEFAQMKKHPEIAEKILEPLEQFYSLLPLVAGHHEKICGKGYPRGLKDEDIPMGARILAVADVYDALSSDRPYRKGSTIEETIKIMEESFKDDLDSRAMEGLKQYLRESGQLGAETQHSPS